MSSAPSKSRTTVIVIAIVAAAGLFFLLACAGIAAIFFYGMSQAGASMEPEIGRLMSAIDKGEAAAYYQNHTAPALRQITNEAEFVRFCDLVRKRLGTLKSKSQTGLNVRQVNATSTSDLTYNAQFERGPATLHFVWTRAAGADWQLASFSVNSPLLLGEDPQVACPHCHEKAPASAKFCPHCGEPLGEQPAEAPPPPAEQESEPLPN